MANIQDCKITTYADNVKTLSNYPSDDGITAEQLKALFDGRTDKEVKTKHNAIVDAADTLNADYLAHKANTANPHGVTKVQIGLGNANNTSDLNKPISTATQAALDDKVEVTDFFTLEGDFILHTLETNPHGITASTIGLGNADNTSDLDKPISAAQQAALDGKADLDENGKVLVTQLPSYVDDVLEYDSFALFPATGETGKIYLDKQTNLQYRWGGSSYIGCNSMLALGETAQTAYYGNKGKTAYDHSQVVAGNPHGVTKGDVGLGNVDNTSDTAKPVSIAQQAALDLKRDLTNGNMPSKISAVNALKPTATLSLENPTGVNWGTISYHDTENGGVAMFLDRGLPISYAYLDNAGSVVASGIFYTETNPQPYNAFVTLSIPTFDCAVSDKASITLSADTEITIENAYNGFVGVIYVYGGYALDLPENSTKSADFDYVTTGTGEFYEYIFVYDGTNYHWTRTVRE